MRSAKFIFLLFLSLVLSVPSSAQVRPHISGVVLDPSHAVIPRAIVRLLSPGSKEIAHILSDQQGRFAFSQSCDEGCVVEVQLPGFETKKVPVPLAEPEISMALAPIAEQINVTANRMETPTVQVGSSVTTVSAKEIEDRQSLAASDFLQSVPGATVNRSGGLGTVTSLFIRGGDSTFAKVLVDGVPLNQPGGFFDFSDVTADGLERIEIVRGPQSALFGTDAMTGVVQLFTRRGSAEDPKPHLRFDFDAGKYDTFHGGVGASGQLNNFDYDGYWSRVDTNNQGPDADFRNSTGGANLGYSIGDRTQIRWILRGTASHSSTPGQTAFGPPDTGEFLSRADGSSALSINDHITQAWNQRLTYSYDRSRQVSRDDIVDPPFTPTFGGVAAPFQSFDFLSDFINDTRRQELGYQSDLTLGSGAGLVGRHILTFAFDWEHENGFVGDPTSGSPSIDATRNNFGGTFQHQVALGRLFLSNGVRVEHNGSFGNTIVPRSSAAFLLRQGSGLLGASKLKFNFGLGFEEPTFTESFSPDPSFLGNPNLRPIRTRSFDFGVEQRLWNDKAKVEVNWFDNRFRDEIVFQTLTFSPVFTGTFINLNKTKAKGAELVVETAPLHGLKVTANYTYLDSRVVETDTPDDPVFGTGKPLLRRPRHTGSLAVLWGWRKLTLSSTTLYVGRRADSDFVGLGLTTSNPFSKWDLAWTYRITKQISYVGVFENLLDRSYMESLGFPALRATYRTGLRLRF